MVTGIGDRIRGSFSLKLTIALLVTVGVMAVAGVVVQAQTGGQVEEDAERNVQRTAEVQASEMDQWITGNKRQARTLSQRQVLQTDDPSQISPALNTEVEEGHVATEVVAIHYLNLEEKQITASSKERFVGTNPKEQQPPFLSKIKEGFAGPDEVYVSEPFRIPIADFPVVAILTPVPDQEKRFIVFMMNPTGQTTELRQPVEGGFTTVVTDSGSSVATPEDETGVYPDAIRAEISSSSDASQVGVAEVDDKVVGYAQVEETGWIVLSHAPREQAYALTRTVRRGMAGMFLLGVLGLGLIGVTVGRNTSRSLKKLARRAREFEEGSLEGDLETSRRDEIGQLYEAFDSMRHSLSQSLEETQAARERAEQQKDEMEALANHLEEKATELGDVTEAAANGDLTLRMETESENESMTRIAASYNTLVGEMETTIAELRAFADQVATYSEEVTASSEEIESASESVSASVQDISRRTDEQHEKFQIVTERMNEVSATTEEIASLCEQVSTIAERTATTGKQGREAARRAIKAMEAIDEDAEDATEEIEALQERTREVEEIAEFIADVAEQTNMLALNANIEASRRDPESEGGGFGAVAEEVKQMSDDTREAAEEIETIIHDLRSQTETAVTQVTNTREEIVERTDSVRDAATALSDIADYAEETHTGVQEITTATQQQAASTQEVVAMVEEAASISEAVNHEAGSVASAAEEQTSAISEVTESASRLSVQAGKLREQLEEYEVDAKTMPKPELLDDDDGPDDGDRADRDDSREWEPAAQD
jgi:methyl-accepting chemotaxis protein